MTTYVFFDGVCNLCSFTVDFLLRYDRNKNLKFGALQSPNAQRILAASNAQIDPKAPTSIIVKHGDQIYLESDAIVRIGLSLGGIFKILANFFRPIPRGLRDSAYRVIARRRYRLFGRRSTCRIPTLEERERFIDLD